MPHLKGKLNGNAMRVPIPDGSVTDFTATLKTPATVEEINAAFKKAAEGSLKGILEYTTDPIVSIDIIGNRHSCIFDADLTMVIGNTVKVVGWYDNEAGYSNRAVDLIKNSEPKSFRINSKKRRPWSPFLLWHASKPRAIMGYHQ
jgi:glyceraldehyde 3-phosphate dehydrogenase